MKTKKTFSKKITITLLASFFLSFTVGVIYPVYAYFREATSANVRPHIDINILFGRLDESIALGDWGTDTNPFLIQTNQHLINLYVLQNSADSFIIDETSVFQVSNEFGEPIRVGGATANQLFNMKSIGTEQYPFISKLRGVTTTDPLKYVTLPTGEKSDTSVIGNIRVVAEPGQVDIGLFGNVGPTGPGLDEIPAANYQQALSTLLLYNVQVTSSSLGSYTSGHNYNVTSNTFETNHVGILVGHAQYVKMNQISVYYSTTGTTPHVPAFDINAGSQSKYVTSGGIVGFFKHVVVDDQIEFPVSSDGTEQGIGQSTTGLDAGIIYTKDIWTFMEEKTTVGSPAPLPSYDLQTTFGSELYGNSNPNETYFHVGVFTFAHSRQARGKDKLAKLWATSGSNQWTIATNGIAGHATTNRDMGPAKKYTATKIEKAQTDTNTSSDGDIKAAYRAPNYRYMIVFESGGLQYALVRYGSTAIGVQIQTSNLVIPDGELEYYTYENLSARTADITYPPYESGYAYRYHTTTTLQFKRTANTSPANRLQYAVYGKLVTDGTGKILEAPRPLRINAQNITTTTPTTSFMATASTTFVEGIRIAPATTGNFTQYTLQRTGSNNTGATSPWYTTFTPADGFSATDSAASATKFSFYAVRTTVNTTTPSESPVTTRYYLQERQPLAASPKKTYNTEENVLYYTGTHNAANPADRYKYDVRSVASLGWVDNDGQTITKGETALMMSDPTSYYYIKNSQGVERYFGVTRDIPSPIGEGTINVPEGSIGFTVNGSTTTGLKAKVFVIVATDPTQGVEQHITISRFGSGTNQVGDRDTNTQYRLVLPPAPATPGVGTQAIYLTDGAASYTTFTNFNKVLVAYTFQVDVQTVPITYFLEASRGAAHFVYLSSERTAANDSNPKHENDVVFPPLMGIDYVSKGVLDQTKIATVGSSEYISSLTMPYFGLTKNPAFSRYDVPLKDHYLVTAVTGFNFIYNISRAYNPTEQKYIISIKISANVNGSGYTAPIDVNQLKVIQQNMNFNFTEGSYLDQNTFYYVYSDIVNLEINGYALTDWSVLK